MVVKCMGMEWNRETSMEWSGNGDDIVQPMAVTSSVVIRTHSIFGDRAFAAAGPGLQNSFSEHLRDADLLYSRLRQSLKTFLFDSGATAQCELF